MQSNTRGLSVGVNSFISDLGVVVRSRNSKSLVSQLKNCPLSKADLASISQHQLTVLVAAKLGNLDCIAEYLLFLRSRVVAQNDVGALETLTLCVKKITASYTQSNGDDGRWLLPLFVFILTSARKFAVRLDTAGDSAKWKKKMVEVYREVFPLLYKERDRLPGTCWLICELLYLYMALNQVKLCSHILAALSQSLSKEGGFRPQSVPKSVAVTLYYYWGKFDVMESRFTEAYDKLSWAFANCPPTHPNKRRIAEYLIPSMIATGVFPQASLIEQCNLDHFRGLTLAIQSGDVASYNDLMEKNMMVMAKAGTLILMEKCKLLCYRNLAKRVVSVIKQLSEDTTKIDLTVFEAAWGMTEDVSRDEMICTLADLIYAGAMKGYIALEHNKLVLSKVNPFPPIQQIMS